MKSYLKEWDTFKELAKENDISLYDIVITNETLTYFTKEEFNEGTIEKVCELVSGLYLKFDCDIALSSVVGAIYKAHIDYEIPLEKIDKYVVSGLL